MNAITLRNTFFLLGLCLTMIGACALSIQPNPRNDNGGSQDPQPEIVTIRFVNASRDQAVQVEFYATNQPLEDIPDEFFAGDSYRILTSIGVAGTGLLQPMSQDTIEFGCTEMLTIGTLGGEFRDNETGEVLGRGDQLYKAPGGFSLCGGTAVYTYSSADGEYKTAFAFE